MLILVTILSLLVTNSNSVGTAKICIVNGDSRMDVPYCLQALGIDGITQDDAYNNSDKIELNFIMSSYNLARVLKFENKGAVTLTGTNQTAHVRCRIGTGFLFTNVAAVKIENMTFVNCGTSFGNMTAAIAIQRSYTVEISFIVLSNSTRTGLFLADVLEKIAVVSSKFISNYDITFHTLQEKTGLYVDSSTVEGAKYHFLNCTFINSSAEKSWGMWSDANTDYVYSHNETGNGMTIEIRNVTKDVEVKLTSCHFYFNIGALGGGLLISLKHSTHNNSVKIVDSKFCGNWAKWKGGGAFISYVQDENMTSNIIQFLRCTFTSNAAEYGGAIFLSASRDSSSCEPRNHIRFENCTWNENQATFGSAVHVKLYVSHVSITKGSLPEPFFSNCHFLDNSVKSITQTNETNFSIKIFGKGALYSNELNIRFQGIVKFSYNSGSAIFLVSSILKISNSNTTFSSNVGYNGGGMSMLRNSAIHLEDHAYVYFENNTATSYGGGIYHETYNDPFETGIHRCFIRYTGMGTMEENVEVLFSNNFIRRKPRINCNNLKGLSIYLFSLTPCIDTSQNSESVETILQYISNIRILDYKNESDVSTLASHYKDVDKLPLSFIPGKETDLGITVEDDTNTSISQVTYSAILNHIINNSEIKVDPAYEVVRNNIIKLVGLPNGTANLDIFISSRPDSQLTFTVTLADCPPGYILLNHSTCECSANTPNHKYLGIRWCNLAMFQAILKQGYWAGYYFGTDSNSFRTSNCPLDFCKVESGKSEISLPQDGTKMDEFLCHNGRHGRVCSLCKNGTSLFYHTQGNAQCDINSKCHLGMLFYILSEIIPVTIFFPILLLLDVKLTSGSINGFVFYVQSLNTLEITAGNFITFPPFANGLLVLLKFLNGMFNLEFFLLPKFSFCLFKNANYLHLLLFSYVTILYALLLIIVTVMVMNSRLRKYFVKVSWNNKYKSTSIIHGLSSFLIICFSRSIKASLQILNPVTMFGAEGRPKEKVVYYHGEYDYLGKEHKPFAFLAILTLGLTCLPVLLLLLYPAGNQFLAFLRLDRTIFCSVLCKIFPLEKLKPFFDSFQSAFKDKQRYFAGLFFVYRFIGLVIHNATNSNTKFFFGLEVYLVVILTFHGIIHPHKENWHNQTDIFILSVLALLNGITAYNYHLTLAEGEHRRSVEILATLQVILAYLPLLYIAMLLLLKLKIKAQNWYLIKFTTKLDSLTEERVNDDMLEVLDLHDKEVSLTSSYHITKTNNVKE